MDLSDEKLLPLAHVAGVIPGRRLGKPIALGTLYRWTVEGLRGVKLETTPIGGQLYTSLAAVLRFSQSVQAERRREKVRLRTPNQRRRGIDRALTYLRKQGVLNS